MPVHTQKRGKKWQVVDDAGKVYGSHADKKKANDQVTAINIKEGYVPGLKPKKP
jgi:hypothetical protein